MPYKDLKKSREAHRDLMRKKRGVTPGVTSEGVTELGVTEYPAIIRALVDPIKRAKLGKVYQSLSDFKQEKNVYYGYPDKGVPFDMIGELLEATK